MKRVYVYLIFACLIFAAQATVKNFLTAKISQSTVCIHRYSLTSCCLQSLFKASSIAFTKHLHSRTLLYLTLEYLFLSVSLNTISSYSLPSLPQSPLPLSLPNPPSPLTVRHHLNVYGRDSLEPSECVVGLIETLTHANIQHCLVRPRTRYRPILRLVTYPSNGCPTMNVDVWQATVIGAGSAHSLPLIMMKVHVAPSMTTHQREQQLEQLS